MRQIKKLRCEYLMRAKIKEKESSDCSQLKDQKIQTFKVKKTENRKRKNKKKKREREREIGREKLY